MSATWSRSVFAMLVLIAGAVPAEADTPGLTILAAAASQSVSIGQAGEGGTSFDGNSWTGLGDHGFGNANGAGFTSAAAGVGTASARIDALGSGGASATLTYEYVFTARTPGEVVSLVQNRSNVIGCSGSGTAVCTLGGASYYFPAATTITGTYHLEYGPYGSGGSGIGGGPGLIGGAAYTDASVFANGFGPPGLSQFTAACGYSDRSAPGCSTDFASTGQFTIDGVLAVDAASLAANSFYGFIKIGAFARSLEGGHAFATIDPIVSFALPGVDPANFSLTLSPGFTNTGAVPEPAAWALMLAGFGVVGSMARRTRMRTVAA